MTRNIRVPSRQKGSKGIFDRVRRYSRKLCRPSARAVKSDHSIEVRSKGWSPAATARHASGSRWTTGCGLGYRLKWRDVELVLVIKLNLFNYWMYSIIECIQAGNPEVQKYSIVSLLQLFNTWSVSSLIFKDLRGPYLVYVNFLRCMPTVWRQSWGQVVVHGRGGWWSWDRRQRRQGRVESWRGHHQDWSCVRTL